MQKADEMESTRRPRVVIIGGGFGGLNAARALRKAPVDVVLIDRQNHHLFQPLLYQVATAGLSPGDIASPIRGVLAKQKNVRVVLGEVESIDREARRVEFHLGFVEYDYLIVAAGVQTNYFGHQDWEEHAPGLKNLRDALGARRRVLKAFEEAEWTEDLVRQRALLTFVVVGAGPTGVELAGAIREIAYQVMRRDFHNIDPDHARVVLIDAAPQVLPGYSPKSSARAERDLREMGVEIFTETRVDNIDGGGVDAGGLRFDAATVLWAAGVKGASLGQTMGAEVDRMGRVIVGEDLRVPGDPWTYVVGDLAHVKGPDGEPLLGLAPVAIQQGRHVARQIRRQVQTGRAPEVFAYRDKGKMATIGRARAIAEVGGRCFAGFFAWLMWLVVHLLFLIGFRNRLFVVMDWFYAYVFSRRAARLITEPVLEIPLPLKGVRLPGEGGAAEIRVGWTEGRGQGPMRQGQEIRGEEWRTESPG